MHDLTGFQRDLLYVIAGADRPSGQTVKDEVEKYYSSEINHGRLYPNLDTLVNKELVEKGQLDRRTNYYAITDAGRQQIKDRREWEGQYIDFWGDRWPWTAADCEYSRSHSDPCLSHRTTVFILAVTRP